MSTQTQNKYNVHAYIVVRVLVPGINATSPVEAAQHVNDNLYSLAAGWRTQGELAEETLSFLVDTQGGNGYKHSVLIDVETLEEDASLAPRHATQQSRQRPHQE